jgi:hypothetical protein
MTVSLKYQLKHFVKIVVAWRMKVRLVVCAVDAVWRVTRHTASTAHTTSRTFMRHATTILTKCFN